jgi:hypothetical protein
MLQIKIYLILRSGQQGRVSKDAPLLHRTIKVRVRGEALAVPC